MVFFIFCCLTLKIGDTHAEQRVHRIDANIHQLQVSCVQTGTFLPSRWATSPGHMTVLKRSSRTGTALSWSAPSADRDTGPRRSTWRVKSPAASGHPMISRCTLFRCCPCQPLCVSLSLFLLGLQHFPAEVLILQSFCATVQCLPRSCSVQQMARW